MRNAAGEDDRMSELPEPIIHHILRSLRSTRDVARTSALSKHRKRLFDSYPSFHFDERWFGISWNWDECTEEHERFKEYVAGSIASNARMISAGWIRAAIAKNVKELDVRVSADHGYELPIDLPQSSAITFMTLTGGGLYGLASMKMCNLRGISIKMSTFFNSDLMKKIEENCPLLEDFRIIQCYQLSHLEISSLVNLKRVEVGFCGPMNRIQIAAPNLETFWFHSYYTENCIFDLRNPRNLRNLTLCDWLMSNSALEDFISMCPLLEKLELRKCSRMEKLRICSERLKSLALLQCSKLDEVDVNAPNLHSFQYEGHMMFFPLVTAPRVSEVKLCFKPCKNRLNAKRGSFFSDLYGSKGVRMIIYTKKTMKIFEQPREVDFLRANNVCRMELTASSPSKVVKNVENWLREKRRNSLVLVSPDGELLELVNTLITEREDSPSCCRFHNSSNKCWRHFIEDVKVSTSETVEKITYHFTWKPKIYRRNEQDREV